MTVGPQTQLADNLHAMKYRSRNEDFREAMNRIAFGLKDDDHHYHALREILLEQRFLPGGRVQGAIGATRQTTAFNCYVAGTIADSYTDGPGSIMARAHEAAATMRMGGGIGYDFSTLRPRGALVRKLQSQATGPISFMRIFNEICLCTASSGHRRGAQMGVLSVQHPDIEEFILAKQNATALTGFNISVAVTDEFMEAALNNKEFDLKFQGIPYRTIDAAELWERIMRSTYDYAEPGVLFIDRVNEMNNLYYAEMIAATNPCFTGDTLVWTAEGHKSFRDLSRTGKPIKVLTLKDGRFVYRTMRRPRMTQSNAKLLEITLTRPNGKKKSITTTVRCTLDHKFYLRDGSMIMARDLEKGMRITSVYRAHRGRSYVGLHNHVCAMMEHHVPFENVKGLGETVDAHHIDEDKKNNKPSNLELKDHGTHSREHKLGDRNPMRTHPERNHFWHKDNHGANNGMYGKRHKASTLRKIGDKTRARFTDPAFRSKHSDAVKAGASRMTPKARTNNHIVKAVRHLDIRENVYCGTVDDTHSFFIATGQNEGVLVRNCGEQPLPPHGACLLGSFNLTKYLTRNTLTPILIALSEPIDEAALTPGKIWYRGDGNNTVFIKGAEWGFDWDQLKQDIPTVVRAMDNVTDRTRYPLAEQRAEALSKRRMGLGITGLANTAEAMGHAYGSSEFLQFESAVLKTILRESYLASADLARTKGSFPLFDAERYLAGGFMKTLDDDIRDSIRQYGLRNSHLTSIAPTGTISMCADNVSSSIEPVFSYSTQRPVNTPDGQTISTLEDYGASVMGVRGKLAADVTASEHVNVLTTAQRFVDSAVSKTINMDGRVMPWADFKGIYQTAWENGAKGCTTFNIAGQRMALLSAAPEEGATCNLDPETGRRDCA